MPHYKANGTYVDDTRPEKFANTDTPLTNVIKQLKNLTPEQAYVMKFNLQAQLYDLTNRLDNINQEQSHDIVKKLVVILSNFDNMMINATPNIDTISKVLPELISGIGMLLAQTPK
jgi:hypothetical protein